MRQRFRLLMITMWRTEGSYRVTDWEVLRLDLKYIILGKGRSVRSINANRTPSSGLQDMIPSRATRKARCVGDSDVHCSSPMISFSLFVRRYNVTVTTYVAASAIIAIFPSHNKPGETLLRQMQVANPGCPNSSPPSSYSLVAFLNSRGLECVVNWRAGRRV